MKQLALSILSLSICSLSVAQRTPAPTTNDKYCIQGGTFHLGNGEVMEAGFLAFENGTITSISPSELPAGCDQVIQAEGKHIYPGFIAPNSTLGLVEIDAVRATRDQRETGSFNPHIRSIIAYNPESRITETVRSNGVLMGQITPRGGWISGTSSIVQFDAWNWEDAIVKEDEGIHVNWPSKFQRSGWWANPGPTKPNEKYSEQRTTLSNYFKKAASYKGGNSDLRMQAMKGLFSGKTRLYVHCSAAQEILDVIAFKADLQLQHLVIVGAYEAYKVLPELKEAQIPVLLQRVHSLPEGMDDDIHLPFKLPAMLHEAGIQFAFDNSGDMEQMQTRNLPSYGGTAVAYGLPYEDAVKALTYSTANILGIAENYGSLETGKSATLFISAGDALDMLTNQVEAAFIDGRKLDLGNRQKDLFEKFSTKYKH